MKVSKSCVPSCFETVYDGYSKHASTTSCCQYDLCNGAGLATPKDSGPGPYTPGHPLGSALNPGRGKHSLTLPLYPHPLSAPSRTPQPNQDCLQEDS